jgi:hypothetical protein
VRELIIAVRTIIINYCFSRNCGEISLERLRNSYDDVNKGKFLDKLSYSKRLRNPSL